MDRDNKCIKMTNNISQIKSLISDPYKGCISKLIYWTRTQEDYNYILKHFISREDSARVTNNDIALKYAHLDTVTYIQNLKGYKQGFILNYNG